MGEKRPKIQQLLAFDLEGRGGEVDFSSAMVMLRAGGLQSLHNRFYQNQRRSSNSENRVGSKT